MAGFKVLVPVAAALMIGMPHYVMAQNAGTQTGGFQVKSLQELDEDNQTARWNNLTVDQLEDMDIVDANGDEVGDVEEILADGEGNIVAITAEVGGFLGIGEKEVIVSVDQLEVRDDKLTTSLSKEQMEALPRWDDD